MKTSNRLITGLFAVLLMVLLLCSCAYLPNPLSDKETSDWRSEIVAVDLVNALMQIEGMHPIRKIVFTTPPRDDFGHALHRVMRLAGYRLNPDIQPDGRGYLGYSVSEVATSATEEIRSFGITLDTLQLQREYKMEAGRVSPASSLFVKGADPSAIQLNDQIFNPGNETLAVNKLAERQEANSVAITSAINRPRYQEFLPRRKHAVNAHTNNLPVGSAPPQTARANYGQINAAPTNMYTLGKSNFAEVLSQYKDVNRLIVTFRNDDHRFLGKENKMAIRRLIDNFDESTDILSIIGCSHGNSQLPIDDPNALLALGRAGRIKEELLISGLSASSILDEGCWSSEHFDEVMPRRAAVLSLKRKQI